MKIKLCLIAILLFPHLVSAEIWKSLEVTNSSNQSKLDLNFDINPSHYHLLELDLAEVQKMSDRLKTIQLPLPNGEFEVFSIETVAIMEPALALKFPEIKTFRGHSIDNSSHRLVLDITPKGLHAVIKTQTGRIWIDPIHRHDPLKYISYYSSDAAKTQNWQCSADEINDSNKTKPIESFTSELRGNPLPENELVLKTYRLAIAATGEYTAFHSSPSPANVLDGMAAIVTAMNRVNGIYESELGIRMILVANNDQIVFTDPITDGFSNNDGFSMLSENQSIIDTTIGSANYDIGHVFSTGGGGIASLGVPCLNGSKARGVTGLNSPVNDVFYVDYVSHEMGHQWGANHIFNSVTSFCNGNRFGPAAVEPGSGSTILGYAGICGADDLQNFSDAYFNSHSLEEITNYANNFGNCSVNQNTNNQAPVVEAGDDFSIPKLTPFSLCADASDIDSTGLTYNWEQNDTGPSGSPQSPTGNAPIFRSYEATNDNCRTFPKLADILNQTSTLGEILPSYARNLNFRVTVRDNELNGGAFSTDDINLNVTDDGPFELISHNSGSFSKGLMGQLYWNVANTDQNPVNCSSVNVFISTDGGQSFVLENNSPFNNNGLATIQIPDLETNMGRIKVECSNNVFFSISKNNLIFTDDLIFKSGFN
jgi:hypothetical protein